jgi:hypothetical protein
MTDKELLEAAARAACVSYQTEDDGTPHEYFDGGLQLGLSGGKWNPLTDDGDALRLANVLAIDVLHRFVGGRRCEALAPGGNVIEEFANGDICAAARRAIVRAAASMEPTGRERG